MVEVLSDPAGLGYIYERDTVARIIGDATDQYNEGELADICEDGGPKNTTSDDSIAYMPFLGTSVSRYWSNSDGNCEPRLDISASYSGVSRTPTLGQSGGSGQSGRGGTISVPAVGGCPPGTTVHTLVDKAGNPLVRLTGSVHDWSQNISIPPSDVSKPLCSLTLYIQTGSDDLRGGGGVNDNADVKMGFASGTVITGNINHGQSWGENSKTTANILLPAGALAGNIISFTLHTNFAGGCCGDNWNVNHVTLIATY